MTPELITSIGWVIMKVLTIIGLSLYAIFAWILFRQEQLMAKVLTEQSETVLRIFALVHLIASIAVVFLALILL